jgi:single-strand DNA-binding protein
MRSINKVVLIGNLTRDAELKQTTGGQPIATFGLATNRGWVTRGGDKQNSSEFHECVAWGKLAEICGQFLKKGKLIYVEGYLKTRSWENEDGTKRFRTEIVVNDMIMLEKKGNAEHGHSEDYTPNEEDYMMPLDASTSSEALAEGYTDEANK